MTARDEAIDAALLAYVREYTGEETIEDADREGYLVDDMRLCMEEAIDAIPADVLARLAIVRDALQDAGWVSIKLGTYVPSNSMPDGGRFIVYRRAVEQAQ